MPRWSNGFVALLVFAQSLMASHVFAQTSDEGNPLRQASDGSETLATSQSRLAERYDNLELLAGRLAELSRATQPRRAKLLRELVAKSRENDIAGRFDAIIGSLDRDSLGKAVAAQGELQADLQKLLELLLQEDRERQIESERKRVLKYLAEIKRLIQFQRGIKARTDGGDQAKELTDDQSKLAKLTGKLRENIEANEGASGEKKTGESGSQDPENNRQQPVGKSGRRDPGDKDSSGDKSKQGRSDSKSLDKKPSEGQPSEGQPSSDPSGESSPKNAQSGKQSAEGKPSESQSSDGQGQSQQSSGGGEPSEQSQSPAERAQQRLMKAQQRMRQALQQLEEAEREKAVDRQKQALRALEQAKAELERILRQLREEELERMLVLLEARFRKMLDLQNQIYEQTVKLESSRSSVPEHEIEIASGRLRRQQRQVVREADRALVLLREDGTTVAFPEAVEQARDDMQTIEKRLGEVKLGLITQGLEEDVIAALEETLAALQQALKKVRQQKSQPPSQQQQGGPGEQSLVDQLAELRMIRALQGRINRRTKRYGEILGDQPAVEQELIEALDELAIRQERVFEATRDLDSGRNR